jgi:hypothetical protein
MPLFDVYMDFYGKKLKTLVEADNEFRAEQKVRAKLTILKIIPADKKEEEPKKHNNNDFPDFGIFGDIFNFK